MLLQQIHEEAKLAIQNVQRKYRRPPEREKIRRIVSRIMRRTGMKGTVNAKYFRLWATCALLNKEAMCRFWKKRSKKK